METGWTYWGGRSNEPEPSFVLETWITLQFQIDPPGPCLKDTATHDCLFSLGMIEASLPVVVVAKRRSVLTQSNKLVQKRSSPVPAVVCLPWRMKNCGVLAHSDQYLDFFMGAPGVYMPRVFFFVITGPTVLIIPVLMFFADQTDCTFKMANCGL